MAEDAPIEPPAAQPPSRWPIAVAAIAISLIILAGYVFRSCADKPAKVAESVSKALQPQVSISTVIQTSLERLRDESKLVVFTADVAVMITKFSEKKMLYGKLDLGTSTVRLRAAGNKAQIIIPMKHLASSDFRYDEAADQLTVTLPAPRVDESLVEVQTDPNYYELETDLGWARLDRFSGDFLREQARRDLRPAVILEANQPRIMKMAEESGREKISALLEASIKPLRPNTKVVVEFQPRGSQKESVPASPKP
jgi:hypothetical protein